MRTFFMGWGLNPNKPIKLNRAFFTFCAILRFVVASAAEAKLSTLFLNCKQAITFQLTLEEMGHPQPPTPINCDNSTAVGIANNNVKQQRSCSMEMRFIWVEMLSHKESLTSNTTQGRKTLETTRVSTMLVHTTQQSLLGTSTNQIVSGSSHVPVSLALWKGVLELWQMGM